MSGKPYLHQQQLPMVLLLAILLNGCSQQTVQSVSQPTVITPDKWVTDQPITDIADNLSTPNKSSSYPQPVNWLKEFNSPELNQLVTESMTHNQTLQKTILNWQSAQQSTLIAETHLRPTIKGGLSSQRSRSQSSTGLSSQSTQHTLQLTALWEPDLWNRLSDQQRAAAVREQASATDLRAAKLSLAASVSRNWFAAVEQKQQIQLSQKRLQRYQQALEVIEARYRRGLTDALDLHLARSEVALSKERLLIQQLNLKQQLRTLEILVGRYPSATITVTDSLPAMSTSIPAGLPSELLDRRPDINASHARWQATVFDTEVAAKRRLPSFSLTAQSGTSSSELKDLLDWDHLLWNLLGNLSQPLFQQDQLKAEERIKLINQKQAATDYAEIVFNAFHEVENHLTAEQFQQQRVHVLLQAAEESGKASDLALSRYQSGLIDILTLLDTQQRAYDQQSAHLNAIAKHIDNRIQLYLALGGSF